MRPMTQKEFAQRMADQCFGTTRDFGSLSFWHDVAGIIAEGLARGVVADTPAPSPNRGDAFAEMQAAGAVTTITITKPDLAAFDLPNARNALRELTLLREAVRAASVVDTYEDFGEADAGYSPRHNAVRLALHGALRAYETRGDAADSEASVEGLPDGWGWRERINCVDAVNGEIIARVDGGSFTCWGRSGAAHFAPIPVVLAVISRNAKGAE